MEQNLSDINSFLDNAGRLVSFPAKHKKKLKVIWYLAGKIEAERQYSESEINDLLDEWTVFKDHATVRREFYNKMLLNRTNDCSRYWKPKDIPSLEEFLEKNI